MTIANITTITTQVDGLTISWTEGVFNALPSNGTTTIPGTFDSENMPLENIEEALRVWDSWLTNQQ